MPDKRAVDVAKGGQSQEEIELTPEAVGALLKNLLNPRALGDSQLARAPFVTQELRQLALRNVRETRGLIVADLLERLLARGVSESKPDSGQALEL